MDDLLALDGGSSATQWQKKHAARQRRKLQKQHRAEAKAEKAKLLREARADLKKRKARWWADWRKRAEAAKAAGLPRPSRAGQPHELGINNPQVVDMTGMTFGRLTVVRSAPVSLTGRTSQRCRVWVVKCSCGSPERYVNGTSLRQGNSNSCGCLKRERIQQAGAKRRAARQKLDLSPLSVRLADLRHRVNTGKVRLADSKLISQVRQIVIEEEIRLGIRKRRNHAERIAGLLPTPVGVPARLN